MGVDELEENGFLFGFRGSEGYKNNVDGDCGWLRGGGRGERLLVTRDGLRVARLSGVGGGAIDAARVVNTDSTRVVSISSTNVALLTS